ncbi:lipopolysaccharide biosynthesis protein [Botrimarina colliarenosi]|uniref:lipopolysaccharide biosynthesis protein n=1 Tax=Botrimarina colliarenosi TaxID=2528001 RepID=UPI0011B4C071|nr:hypothetical protein [Botrimarina colliarenosi]
MVSAKLLIILSTAIRATSALVLMPLMISAIGREHYGLWISITTVTMYLSLSESGIGQTVVNEIGRAYALEQKERISQIMATAFAIYCTLILIAGSVAIAAIILLPIGHYLLSEQDAARYEPLLKACLVASTLLALLRIPTLVFPGLLIGVRRLPLRTLWEIGGSVIALVATVLAIYCGFGLLGLTVTMNSALFAVSAAICLSSRQCGEWARLRLRNYRGRLVGPLLASSVFYFLIGIAGVLDRSLTILLAPRLDSLSATPAFFLLTSLFRTAAYSIIAAMPRAVQPYIVMWSAKRQTTELRRITHYLTKATTVAATLFVATVAPFARQLVNGWLGYEGYPGDVLFWMVAGAFLIESFACTPVFVLIAMNRQRLLAGLLIVKAAMSGVGAIVLAPHFDAPLVGVAAASVLTSVLAGIAIPFLIRSAIDATWRDYLQQSFLRPLAFASLVPFAAAIIGAVDLYPIRLAATAILSLVAILAAWHWVLSQDDRSLTRQAWNAIRSKTKTASSPLT